MSDAFMPAIEALRQQLAKEEKAVSDTKKLINKLSEVAGLPTPFADTEETSGLSVGSIRADTFYGKKLFTAAREYLEMRKVANLGPAETRDIYENISRGGFHFEAADANNAMTGLRAMMNKNTAMFHRLPNGTWGLRSWYESIKPTKGTVKSAGESESADDGTSAD